MSRRRKIIYIPKEYIFLWFSHGKNPLSVIMPGVPEDVTLIDVYYSFERDSFEFKLEHPSFEEVSPGEMYPEIAITFSFEDDRQKQLLREWKELCFGKSEPTWNALWKKAKKIFFKGGKSHARKNI